MNLKLFLTLILTATSSWAFDIQAQGRNYTFVCGYFTSVQGDVVLTFKDSTLPWGSSVVFITGWEGREGFPEKRFEWRERKELLAPATAPYTWSIKLTQVLHERSKAQFKDTLNWVIKVIIPGQPDRYLKGESPWGFYRVRLVENSPGRCVTGLDDLPNFSNLAIETVDRD